LTHSASLEDIKILYQFANSVIGEDSVIIDIGSRLGTILYYGYYNSNANFIGIEMNSFFIEIQKKIIKKFKLGDKIKVIENDIRNEK